MHMNLPVNLYIDSKRRHVKNHIQNVAIHEFANSFRGTVPMTQHDTAQQYLTSGNDILDGMDAQTEDVIGVLGVEALRVILLVVHDPHRRHVVAVRPDLRLSLRPPRPTLVSPRRTHRHPIRRRGPHQASR